MEISLLRDSLLIVCSQFPWAPADKSIIGGCKNWSSRNCAYFVSIRPGWFGAPVGNVQAWVESMWAPRFRRVIANLRRAFSRDPEAAIAAAHLSGGHGASAAPMIGSAPAQ